MAALNFPNSPTVGQIYMGYIWTGSVWRATGGMRTARSRGRFRNPNMQWSQQNGVTAGNTTGYFFADMWACWRNVGAGVISAGRVAKDTPNRSVMRGRAIVTTIQTTLTSGNYVVIEACIEGYDWADLAWGTAKAIPAVLRFGVNLPTGLYHFSIANSPVTRTYVGAFNISAAQAGTDVEIVAAIPAITTGTWDSSGGKGIIFEVCIASGSSNIGVLGWQTGSFMAASGQLNGLAALNTYEVFDGNIYADPDNTGLPPLWEAPDPYTELARVQRYWQSITVAMGSVAVTSGSTYNAYGKLTVPTRLSSPTLAAASQFASSFPATSGTVAMTGPGPDTVVENRVANATAVGSFRSNVTVDSRM